MKRIRLSTFQFNLQVGLRLLLASIVLMLGVIAKEVLGASVLAGIIMLWPANNSRRVLATGLTAEEELAQMKMLKTVEDKVREVMKDATKGAIGEKELTEKLKEVNLAIKELTNQQIVELKTSVEKMVKDNEVAFNSAMATATETIKLQGAEIKKLSENTGRRGGEAVKSFREAMREAIMEKKDVVSEVNDENGKRLSIKQYFDNGNKNATFTIKVAVDMLQSNIVGSGVNEYRLTDSDPNRVSIPLAVYPHVIDVFSVKNMSRPFMSLLVVVNYEDGAATKAEGVASGKSSFTLETKLFKAVTIATHYKLSDETLDDLEEVLDEISAIGPDKVLSAMDRKVLGTTGDDVSDIKGIRTTGSTGKSTAFVAATVPDTADAKIADLIMGTKLQAEEAGYKPNVVIISPELEYLMGAEKDTTENSRQDRRIAFDNIGRPSFVGGLRIVSNGEMPSNQLVTLDNKLAWIGRRKDMTMEIGYDGNDLTEGKKTVVIKIRVAFGVRDKAGVIWVSAVDNMIAQITAS
jgi:TolA-binding protein